MKKFPPSSFHFHSKSLYPPLLSPLLHETWSIAAGGPQTRKQASPSDERERAMRAEERRTALLVVPSTSNLKDEHPN